MEVPWLPSSEEACDALVTGAEGQGAGVQYKQLIVKQVGPKRSGEESKRGKGGMGGKVGKKAKGGKAEQKR